MCNYLGSGSKALQKGFALDEITDLLIDGKTVLLCSVTEAFNCGTDFGILEKIHIHLTKKMLIRRFYRDSWLGLKLKVNLH